MEIEIDQKNCVSQVQANYLVAGRLPHLRGCFRSLCLLSQELVYLSYHIKAREEKKMVFLCSTLRYPKEH
jgi:hypothetical protein